MMFRQALFPFMPVCRSFHASSSSRMTCSSHSGSLLKEKVLCSPEWGWGKVISMAHKHKRLREPFVGLVVSAAALLNGFFFFVVLAAILRLATIPSVANDVMSNLLHVPAELVAASCDRPQVEQGQPTLLAFLGRTNVPDGSEQAPRFLPTNRDVDNPQ